MTNRGYFMNKGALWNTIQVAAEICIYDFSMASVDQLVDASHRVQRAAVLPIGVLFWLQIGLENRFEHQNRCHFRCPITDSGPPNGRCFPSGLGIYTRRT